MNAVKITQLNMKRRKLLPFLDFSGFFMVFGITGLREDRQYRLNRRFEQEYFNYRISAKLSEALAPGLYRLEGLPEEANKRGWRVSQAHHATTDLSEEGWQDLQRWQASHPLVVQAVKISELPFT